MTHPESRPPGTDVLFQAGAICNRLGGEAQANVDEILRALGVAAAPAAAAPAPAPREFADRWLPLADQARDPRTGLSTRTLLWDRLVHALGRHCRYATEFAVLYVGTTDAEELHTAEIARTLTLSLRGTDCATYGGHGDFIALLDTLRTPDDARIAAERVLRDLSHRHPEVTFSIGIGRLHPHGVEPEAVLWKAATAMRRARALGGSRIETALAG
jgi:GGDEF domain-containing protein